MTAAYYEDTVDEDAVDAVDAVAMRPTRPGVLERVTQILDAFITGSDHLSLEDVAAATCVPRSTTFRLLRQLVELHWLEHGPGGYQLGSRAQTMASRVDDHQELRRAAAAALNDLHVATGAVVHLSVLEGATVRYLDKVGGAAAASVPSCVGARLVADQTISGRALLAALLPERVDRLMAVPTRPRTAHDLARLHRHLGRIRQRHGVAFADGSRCPLGISTIAAPVLGPRGAAAAISVAGRGLRFDHVAPMISFAARRTAHLLSA